MKYASSLPLLLVLAVILAGCSGPAPASDDAEQSSESAKSSDSDSTQEENASPEDADGDDRPASVSEASDSQAADPDDALDVGSERDPQDETRAGSEASAGDADGQTMEESGQGADEETLGDVASSEASAGDDTSNGADSANDGEQAFDPSGGDGIADGTDQQPDDTALPTDEASAEETSGAVDEGADPPPVETDVEQAGGTPDVETDSTNADPDPEQTPVDEEAVVVPAQPSWSMDILPFFEASCGSGMAACHSREVFAGQIGSDCRGWLSLADEPLGSTYNGEYRNGDSTGCPDVPLYERLMTISWQCDDVAYVVPGDPDASYLFRKIAGGPLCDNGDEPSEPMPLMGELDADKIQMVRNWIANGAPGDN